MAKKKNLDPKIRQMVCENHGGFENATNDQILRIWNSLDEATKKRYAEKLKAKSPSASSGQGGKTDADSN